MLRVWIAAVPQHVMRGALLAEDLLSQMDAKISTWWADLLGSVVFSATHCEQIYLPFPLGVWLPVV